MFAKLYLIIYDFCKFLLWTSKLGDFYCCWTHFTMAQVVPPPNWGALGGGYKTHIPRKIYIYIYIHTFQNRKTCEMNDFKEKNN